MQKQQVSKLKRKHQELGFRENGKSKNYYGLFKNEEGKNFVADYTGASRTFARLYFQEWGSERGLELKEIRLYQ